METIIAVIVGWLFGLLGQRPITFILNEIKKPSLKESIFVELNVLKCSLTFTSYILYSHIGKIDKEYLLWAQPIIRTYAGFHSNVYNDNAIDKLLELNDEEFKVAVELLKQPDKGLSLKKFNLPFIDSKYSEIYLFDRKFQEGIWEIREGIRRINEQIDMAWFYFSKTYDNLSDENARRVHNNVISEYTNVGNMAVDISKNIITFIDR